MRFQKVILAYFVMGALLWGGGVIQWGETGMVGYLMDSPTSVNEDTSDELRSVGGPIQQAVGDLTGGLVAIWNILVQFVGYLFWPILTLQSVSAPPRATVLVGGSMTVAFIGAFIRIVRQSA